MDKHLNCFYSYNHNNELIENNLTRAFILTLKGISNKNKVNFLSSLNPIFSSYDFSYSNFALQSNIEKDPKKFENKFILTLSNDTFFLFEKEFKECGKELIENILINKICSHDTPEHLRDLCHGSIPDAWIFDDYGTNYCFLIECKKQDDRINYPQLIRHAYENFGYSDINEIEKCIIKLTWHEILEGFLNIVSNEICDNEQERFIIQNFIEFLGFFGYYSFKGFNFNKLTRYPHFNFIKDDYKKTFEFTNLKNPPKFNINFPMINSINRLFNFYDLAKHPNIKLCIKGGN